MFMYLETFVDEITGTLTVWHRCRCNNTESLLHYSPNWSVTCRVLEGEEWNWNCTRNLVSWMQQDFIIQRTTIQDRNSVSNLQRNNCYFNKVYRFVTMVYYNYHNSGHYPSSCLSFKTWRFGDWIFSIFRLNLLSWTKLDRSTLYLCYCWCPKRERLVLSVVLNRVGSTWRWRKIQSPKHRVLNKLQERW
jgi:hypothetical protein